MSRQQRSFSQMNPGKVAMNDPTTRRTCVIVACGIFLFAMLFGTATTNAAESNPNVVLILAERVVAEYEEVLSRPSVRQITGLRAKQNSELEV